MSLEKFESGAKSKVDVDKIIIRRHVRTRMKEIIACYEHELATNPALTGTVEVKFTIVATGDVSEATASGLDPALDRCVEGEIKQVKFPEPKGGQRKVEVNYPLSFKPRG
jgi:hypothetical protein